MDCIEYICLLLMLYHVIYTLFLGKSLLDWECRKGSMGSTGSISLHLYSSLYLIVETTALYLSNSMAPVFTLNHIFQLPISVSEKIMEIIIYEFATYNGHGWFLC